jgi:hypothetical protein
MTVASTPWRRGFVSAVAAGCMFAGFSAVAGPASAAGGAGEAAMAPRLTNAQRAVLLQATWRFRDADRAVAAGYQPTRDCVPGMGYHFVHPGLAGDTNIDPTLPEILVYERDGRGRPRLVALEYFRADADGDKDTDEDKPTLFGHPFDGPMDGHPMPPGAPPMPVHYDLHVWLYKANPTGQLSPMNPRIRCP